MRSTRSTQLTIERKKAVGWESEEKALIEPRISYVLKKQTKRKKRHITGLWPCLIEKGYISKHVRNEICIYISNSEYFHF